MPCYLFALLRIVVDKAVAPNHTTQMSEIYGGVKTRSRRRWGLLSEFSGRTSSRSSVTKFS
jgi:hypothetical protein